MNTSETCHFPSARNVVIALASYHILHMPEILRGFNGNYCPVQRGLCAASSGRAWHSGLSTVLESSGNRRIKAKGRRHLNLVFTYTLVAHIVFVKAGKARQM